MNDPRAPRLGADPRDVAARVAATVRPDVLALTAYHFYLAGYAGDLADGREKLTGKRLRLLNEVPGIAAAFIVVMVIVKPF